MQEKNTEKNCLPPCSGLILTSYTKTDPVERVEDVITSSLSAYNEYSKWSDYPFGLRGRLYDNENLEKRMYNNSSI